MANSDKNIRITTSKNKTTLPNIVFTGSSAGTSVLTLEVRDDNTVAFTGSDGDVFSLDYNLSTGTIWSVNDKSGTPLLRASAGGTIGIAELGTSVIVGIGQTNPRYKLDVQGWVGFASTGDGSYTILVENGLTTGNNALSLRAANALRFYNSGNTLYTGFIGAQSGVNTTYTLPSTSPATGSSVLQSTSAGVLSWVPMTTGGSGSPGGTDTAIQFNDASSFGGTAGGLSFTKATHTLSIGSTSQIALTSIGLQLYNNNASTISVTQRWSPAIEFMGRAYTTPSGPDNRVRFLNEVQTLTNSYAQKLIWKFSYDTGTASYTNPILVLNSQNGVGIGATDQTNQTYLKAGNQSGSDLVYTLPLAYPSGTGTSFLSASTTGVMAWVAAPAGGASGAGSGTVAIPGAQYQVAAYYHSATGASVSGSTTFTNNTATGVVNITHTTESTLPTNGALTIAGGAGIAKSLFVGTSVAVGSTPSYNVTNNLGSFVSSVNTYNQLVIQNKSNGSAASANLVVNNDSSTDSTFYGEIGINSSAFSGTGAFNAPNAVYVSSTSGPLVLGTTTAHPIRFVINSGATDIMYFAESGLGISVFTNLGMRSQSDLRFWNSGNTFYSAIQGGNHTANYILTMPATLTATGTSILVSDSSGNLAFVPITGVGVSATSSNNAISISHLEPFMVTFCSGYTPTATGADSVVFRFPESTVDGTSSLTYQLRRVSMRVETLSSGTSTIRLEKYGWNAGVGTGAFSTSSTGSTLNVLASALNIGGSSMGETFATSASIGFSGNGITYVSGDKLRVNFTALNATHANFTITALIDLIS